MTILSRYLLREVFKYFFMAFAGLMTLYLVVDFFEKNRRFSDYDAPGTYVLLYFLYRLPEIAFLMAPLAVLLATLMSVGLLSRNNEVTAMRSCGISLFRVGLPVVGFAVGVAWALFVISAVVMPWGLAQAEYVRIVDIEKRTLASNLKTKGVWIEVGDRSLMNIELVDPGGATLHGVTLYELGLGFQLQKVVEGKTARYTEAGWVLFEGRERRVFRDGRTTTTEFESRPMDLAQIPEDFGSWLSVESKHMTLLDLKAYAERLRRHGYSYFRFLTDYYDRMAFSFVSIVMALVGFALSLRMAGVRGAGMAMGMGQALVIAFLYWMTRSVSVALGHSGVLEPLVAGWFTNLLFFSFGFYLVLRVRY